ncbi:hypothetical protein V502_03498 [Pseudogymnoascus sp. VKM F-4520 (FW-2644)]|nr:hypothetical protein V502_03498 [Pseudogymnoascus sp. VKM F-4520 (FW-2644)]
MGCDHLQHQAGFGKILQLPGLPEAFKGAAKCLLLNKEVFVTTHVQLWKLQPKDEKALGTPVQNCLDNLDKIEEISRKIYDSSKGKYDASEYRAIAIQIGKQRVETLMDDILKRLGDMLAHEAFQDGMQKEVNMLAKAREELAELPPSLLESDFDEQPRAATMYGDNNRQYNASGSAMQKNVGGNYFEAKGDQNFGTIPSKAKRGGIRAFLLNIHADYDILTDDGKSQKRGLPMKSPYKTSSGVPESLTQQTMSQQEAQSIPLSPSRVMHTQMRPPKSRPTKTAVNALPTVRNHTTDQLSPEGDEYIPMEYDEAGEKKVAPTGHLNDGLEYKCRTFFVPGRGDKLFMLGTECARVLDYKDSYLLFDTNRSLYKIIATQEEKETLIRQDILPSSISRQIAIVTAKSVFRQFGSRVIVNGRRVRDDYWEAKARPQDFTEADMAGEKRPGGAKAKNSAAAEASANATAVFDYQDDVVYNDVPVHFSHPQAQNVQLENNYDPANSNEVIRRAILLRKDRWDTPDDEVVFSISWDLPAFMANQYETKCPLGSVITLSGTAMHAQAITCEEYLKLNWPKYGIEVLVILEMALDSPELRYTTGAYQDFRLFVDFREGRSVIIVSGSTETIIDIAQQLAWMAAALRTSDCDRVHYSKVAICDATGDSSDFDITFAIEPLPEEEESCWFPLFLNPVIAFGFPIRERNNEGVGLELSIEMMVALGRIRHAIDFDGGLLLKGPSSAFVPTLRYKESIQWHFLHRPRTEKLSYSEIIRQCPKRVLLGEEYHESLHTTRAFLGWWGDAETCLGTDDYNYSNTKYSRDIKITGGTFGFSKILTAGVNICIGSKDSRLYLPRSGSVEQILGWAEVMPITLYDEREKRAWLVPASDVILHVIRTRHVKRPFQVDGKAVPFVGADSESHGQQAAAKAMMQKAPSLLFKDSTNRGKDRYFDDEVSDIWSLLERVGESQNSEQSSPGKNLQTTMKTKVIGWEFMGLVDQKSPYVRKQFFVKTSSGGWPELVHDIDAVVLLAQGFEDIIRPVSELARLCSMWQSLPKHRYFMAAGVLILQKLCEEAGSGKTNQHLTSKLKWHKGSLLFEDCFAHANAGMVCKCDRLQQVVPESITLNIHSIKPPGVLKTNGCVIFGKPPSRSTAELSPKTITNSLYTHPNNPIEMTTDKDSILTPRTLNSEEFECLPLDNASTFSSHISQGIEFKEKDKDTTISKFANIPTRNVTFANEQSTPASIAPRRRVLEPQNSSSFNSANEREAKLAAWGLALGTPPHAEGIESSLV